MRGKLQNFKDLNNKKQSNLHLALCANDRFAPGLQIAALSLLKTVDDLVTPHFHILDAGLSRDHRDTFVSKISELKTDAQVRFLTPPEDRFRTVKIRRYHFASYLRLALPEILHEIDEVMYLDADTIVFEDITTLFRQFRLGNNPLAACPDWETTRPSQDSLEIATECKVVGVSTYFNAGVMVLNLNALRENDFTNRSLDLLSRLGQYASFADQSALNALLANQWTAIDQNWNTPSWAFDGKARAVPPGIVHFTNRAPWITRTWTPSQALYEKVATELGVQLPKPEKGLGHFTLFSFFNWVFALPRAGLHFGRMILAGFGNRKDRAFASRHVAGYWLRFFCAGPFRIFLYQREIRKIKRKDFFLPKNSSI